MNSEYKDTKNVIISTKFIYTILHCDVSFYKNHITLPGGIPVLACTDAGADANWDGFNCSLLGMIKNDPKIINFKI